MSIIQQTMKEVETARGVGASPNPHQTWAMLNAEYHDYLRICGIAYLWKVPDSLGRTGEVYCLNPVNLIPQPADAGHPNGYYRYTDDRSKSLCVISADQLWWQRTERPEPVVHGERLTMIRFTLAQNGTQVAVDPDAVVSVRETTSNHNACTVAEYNSGQAGGPLNLKQTAVLVLSNGHEYYVDDPNRTVARQIEEAKRK